MKAFVLAKISDLNVEHEPLEFRDVPIPEAGHHEILIRVGCCGVCHTELDEIEGRSRPPKLPVIPGHQVVGLVEKNGPGANRFRPGDRVGVAWIFAACGECAFCLSGRENLCPRFAATGCDSNGGYAEYMKVREEFAYPLPPGFSDAEAAPLLCAGAIGYRSLKLTGLKDGQTLGLTGFGASGHLVLKMAAGLFPHSPILVAARSSEEQSFARGLGATWAGTIDDRVPGLAHAIIDTTPAWKPPLESLRHLQPGGRLVINAIRKEDNDKAALLEISYPEQLWMEKEIKSVANITRQDVVEFLSLASALSIRPQVDTFPFEHANQVLLDLKHKPVRGAKVLTMARL